MVFNPQPKPKMYRNKKYLDFIRAKRCLFNCPDTSIAHHEDVLNAGGTAIKTHDYLTLPLCYLCHDTRHRFGVASYLHRDTKDIIIELLMEYIEGQR